MLILPPVVAALLTAALIPPLDRWARATGRLLDRPNDRSSHRVPTPRVGGVAIAVGVLAGLALAGATGAPLVARTAVLAAGALAIAAMGVADDLRPASAPLRLGGQAAVAAAVAIDAGPWALPGLVGGLGFASVVVGAVWIVGLVNAYNFMDGIDGLAGGQAVLAGSGWAVVGLLTGAPGLAAVALAVAAAGAAFLAFNWPPARVFMGDTGSAFLGYAFAVIPMAAGPSAPLFAAAALFVWPFLFDATLTFVRRLARGENVVRAHRSHLYQRLTATGLSHRQVSLTYLALGALGLPAGVCAATGRPGAAAALGGVVAVAAVSLWRAVVRREAAAARGNGEPKAAGSAFSRLALAAVLLPGTAAAAPVAYLGSSAFDPVSLSVTATIPLRIEVVDAAGARAYGFVALRTAGATPAPAVLGVLDTLTNTVVATAPMPFEPAGLALDPDGTRLYVTGRTSTSPAAPAPGRVLALDPVTLAVLSSVELAPAVNTSAPLLHPTAPQLYVFRDSTVDVVDTAGLRAIATIEVPTSRGRFNSPFMHPSGNFIYASTGGRLSGASFAVVIDTRLNALARTVSLGDQDRVGAILPRGPDNALLFTTGIILPTSGPGGDVFDAATGQRIASLALPGIPVMAAAHPTGRAVYYSFGRCSIPSCNLTTAGVAVVDGASLAVVAQIPSRLAPGGRTPSPVLSLDPPRGLLYARGESLQTIDLTTDALAADVPFSAPPGPFGSVNLFVFGTERAEAPGAHIFYTLGGAGGATAVAWGEAGDQPVPADYDGDGRADVAVWRPRDGAVEGVWFILRSSDGAGTAQQWGAAAFADQPVPADYDGDGRADIAVWRRVEGTSAPGAREGIWYIVRSSDGVAVSQQWGASGDVPVPADYDGDGRADIAVWRAGTWYIIGSSDGAVRTFVLGEATDVPVPADYDGDGRADLAVWRPSTGLWSIALSRDGSLTERGWGAPGDVPVPADYDGDGRADLAVWRPGTGEWWIVGSASGAVTRRPWGAAGDRPVPADRDGDGRSDPTVYRP